MRVLTTRATVETLFQPCLIPYDYLDNDGVSQHCDMPGWQCRTCGFQSLYGVHNLPYPHECGLSAAGGVTVGDTFTSLSSAQKLD